MFWSGIDGAASRIVNYSASAKSHGLIPHTSVTIGYDVPWRTVHDLLISGAASVPEILAEPAPSYCRPVRGRIIPRTS